MSRINRYSPVPRSIVILTLLLSVSILYAQLPSTDLYLVKYSDIGERGIVRQVIYLSDFNNGGYNNQPRFIATDQLYVTTDKYGEQTDIVKLDLSGQELHRLTYTDESEYSPAPHPNGKSLSVVRTELDGKSQTLTLQSLSSRNTKRLLPDLADIGYYHWVSDDEVILFRLPEPFTMSLANVKTGSVTDLIDRIGRCFRQDEDGLLYFVHKITESDWYIKKYDVGTGKASLVTKTVAGTEDFELLSDGSILMAKADTIYKYDPDKASTFAPWMILSDYGISGISRLANSRGQLIIVNDPNSADR